MIGEDFAYKVDYEGGVIEAIEYGLTPEDIEVTDDLSAELKEKWEELCAAWGEMQGTVYLVEALLDQLMGNDD